MKGLIFLLTLLSAGLGGWAGYEFFNRTRLEGEVATLRTERDRMAKTLRERTSLLDGMNLQPDGPTGLRDQAKEHGINLEEEEEKPATAKNKKPSLKAPGNADADPAAEASAVPDTAALREQAAARLEFDYAELFDRLKLDDAQRKDVLALLRRRSDARVDLSAKAAGAGDRAAAVAEFTKAMDAAGGKLQALLGDGYTELVNYEKSRADRALVRDFQAALKEEGTPLEAAAEAKLLEALRSVRDGFKFERDLSEATGVLAAEVTQEAVDRYVQQHAAMQDAMHQSAAALLDAAQAEALAKALAARQQETMQTLQALRQWSSGKAADARN